MRAGVSMMGGGEEREREYVCVCVSWWIQSTNLLSRVVVVEHKFNDLVLRQHKGVGVAAVDDGIGGVGAGGEDAVERRHLGPYVGYVVEEGTGRCVRKKKTPGPGTGSRRALLTSLRRRPRHPSSYPA